MSPDDAADLIAELPPETAEQLLQLMEPDEAEDVRRLMSYEEHTAGGMMTTEPVILLARRHHRRGAGPRRQAELSPSLAALVYVVPTAARAPDRPAARRRAHPAAAARAPVDAGRRARSTPTWSRCAPTSSLEDVARHLATYNLVAAPVVDDDGRLVGAVTVDDLLDHLLPENWRDTPSRSRVRLDARRGGGRG